MRSYREFLIRIFVCLHACSGRHSSNVHHHSPLRRLAKTLATATLAAQLACAAAVPIPAAVADAADGDDVYKSAPPLPTACTSESNPQITTVSCRRLGLTPEKRLLGCLATENCFSTSAKSNKYVSPWVYLPSLTGPQAKEVLKVAAEENGLKVLKDVDMYLLAAERDVPKQVPGSSLFYEFLVKPDDHIVLYRAFVDKTAFLYPLQQPVSDQGALEGKLRAIRAKTGWRTVSEPTDDADFVL